MVSLSKCSEVKSKRQKQASKTETELELLSISIQSFYIPLYELLKNQFSSNLKPFQCLQYEFTLTLISLDQVLSPGDLQKYLFIPSSFICIQMQS